MEPRDHATLGRGDVGCRVGSLGFEAELGATACPQSMG